MSARERELTLLNHLAMNPEFIAFKGNLIKEYRWEYPTAKLIFSLLFACISQHKAVPTEIELLEMANRFGIKMKHSETERQHVAKEIGLMYSMQSTGVSAELISSCIIEKKSKELAARIMNMSPDDLRKDYHKLRVDLDALFHVDKKDDMGVFVLSDHGIDTLLTSIEEVYTSTYVPTGFPQYDKKLLGGARPGEVFMYMSPPGKMKTGLMINMALNAVRVGKRVVYIILDNLTSEMGERMFASFTRSDITGNLDKEEYRHRILQQRTYEQSKFEGFPIETSLILKKYPPKRFSPVDVSNFLKRLQDTLYTKDIEAGVSSDRAGKIDLVIIDYLEKMLSTKNKEAYRLELESNVEECCNIGHDFHCPVFLPSQGSKDAAKCEQAQIWMAAEAYCKLNPVAHAAIFSQTDEERLSEPSQFRLVVGKSRRPETDYQVFMRFDRLRQVIWEDERPIEPLSSTISTELHTVGVPNSADNYQNRELKPITDAPIVSGYEAENIE